MRNQVQGIVLCCVIFSLLTAGATDHYVSLAGGHVPPFLTWSDAASNIQDAIDVSLAGDVVWVTNGVYNVGGKVMAGDLTNRVALDKPLTVQSVNGAAATIVQGAGAVPGAAAVRCAWLTNGALLKGFTITLGASRTSGDLVNLVSGGGIWCSSSNAFIANCFVISNAAGWQGGGVYQGTAFGSLIMGNSIVGSTSGGGAALANLLNCTVISNSSVGAYQARLTNCISYFNSGGSGGQNYSSSILSYCCTTPSATGNGNITAVPQLIDGMHIANASPCRIAGTNFVIGVDIDGQAWSAPPSIGCDQWQSYPVTFGRLNFRFTNDPAGFKVDAIATGQEPLTCWWAVDGVVLTDDGHFSQSHTTNLVATGIRASDVGEYQVVVSNSFGMTTSAVTQLPVHCVDAAGTGAAFPFAGWATAATNIQDAVDAAVPGDLVLVTNGIYANGGGGLVVGGFTNRVFLNRRIMVHAVNGPLVTIIQGAWDPATNGPAAVRCAWVTNGASLNGFTLRGGATLASSDSGGGAEGIGNSQTFPSIPGGLLVNCIIANNAASLEGGGCHNVVLNRCLVLTNTAGYYGGGVSGGSLRNSLVRGNRAGSDGGGVYAGWTTNCTVIFNTVTASTTGSGGISGTTVIVRNSIVLFNSNINPFQSSANYPSVPQPNFAFTCSSPLPTGTGNISVSPLWVDDGHLALGSPCRGVGSPLFVSGTDIDGEPWQNPPSMGCDEVIPGTLTGPLEVGFDQVPTDYYITRNPVIRGKVIGRASRVDWSSDGGPTFTNTNFWIFYRWTNAGLRTITFTAYNDDNPGGVSTNAFVNVLPVTSPTLTVGSISSSNFVIGFDTQTGLQYVVYYTASLTPPVSWSLLTPFLNGTGGQMQFTHSVPPNTTRFYRVQAQ